MAFQLQASGVEPNELVGIYVGRSLEMVVGILGILMSGGAYVPLDPAYPADRLAFILEDANIQIVVTHAELRDQIPIKVPCFLYIGEKPNWLPRQEPVRLRKSISPENLAYVIYTSGSTGRPKGVMITHDSLCKFVRIAGQALEVLPTDRYLQTASISYALSVRQLMIPLVNGATLVIANSEQIREPLGLFELIKREYVTVMDMVPSFWRACTQRLLSLPVDERRTLLDNNLRRIVSIGEALLSDIPHDWRFRLGHPARLVNIFGQTETTGVVATYPIPPVDQAEIVRVPIGRSVPETVLYVLGDDLKPVPVGETGELYVSSPCLALGYLNQPDLTRQKFIPNPFSNMDGDCLYRTGDMARYRTDGAIDFVGRNDFQVKIRGQRLELEEIEAVLLEHPAVDACVVVAVGEQSDVKYLVAYFTKEHNWKESDLDLRCFLKQRLAEYMLPSIFIMLDEFPSTPNGKIDRKLLSEPSFIDTKSSQKLKILSKNHKIGDKDQLDTENEYVLPRTQTEKIVAKIWRSLLRVDRIGVHQSFFELGGDSLMAVRLFLYIEQGFGVRLPLTSLVNAKTVAQLSELIDHYDTEMIDWSLVTPFQAQGNKSPFFGIHGHEGGVLFWRDLVSALPPDQPFFALQAQGVDGYLPALTNIHDMASLYLDAVRKIQPSGPYYIGGYSMGGEIALEMAQQLIKMGERVNLLVMFETANPARLDVLPPSASGAPAHSLDVNAGGCWIQKKVNRYRKRLYGLNVQEGVLRILRDMTYHIKSFWNLSFSKLYLSWGWRIPDRLLIQYLRISHSRALHSYQPKYYPGKITLFRASESVASNPVDSPVGWRAFAGGGFDMFLFDGDHNLLNGDCVNEIAQKLIECLAEARIGD